MAEEGVLQVNVVSVVEDILQQHGKRLSDIDLASRKAEEASLRRYEAAGWLRKTVGVVAGKDLPAEPSEEDFRLGLRSGIILCNVLNKVQPGSIPKVVEAPPDSITLPDGAALSAYQYFENVRNFLVAIEEMGIPTFEASDLEQGGKSSRIVNCILALRSYDRWKQSGGNGLWKYSANSKPPPSSSSASGCQFVRKNSDLFMNSLSKKLSSEKSLDSLSSEENSWGDLVQDLNDMSTSHSLHALVRELLADKSKEDIPLIVEHMLSKVMQEFERRLAAQPEQVIKTVAAAPIDNKSVAYSDEPAEMQIIAAAPIDNKNVAYSDEPAEMQIITAAPIDNKNVAYSDEPAEMQIIAAAPIDNKNVAYSDEPAEMLIIAAAPIDYNKSADDKTVEMQMKLEVVKEILAKKSAFFDEKHGLMKNQIQELRRTIDSTKEDIHNLQMKHREEVDGLSKHLNTLAHAASGYRKVLEENRKLYNQVQDLKGNIRVYCRVRPFLPGKAGGSSAIEDMDEGNISLYTPLKNGKGKKTSFTFNKVFGPLATQGEVFEDTQPLIRSVLDGYNVCIFAYGQTGSGKTFTMTGPDDLTPETLGVNYRALNDLFLISEQRKDTIIYDIRVQVIEIYNEQVRDLLATDGGLNKRLEIRNNTSNGINVPNANLVPVSKPSDVINLMNLGHKNRAVGSTCMNDRSSRSHSCLTVHVQGRDLTSGSVIRGCMHLVDLAGSERLDKTEATGDRLKEAQHINKSLSALGDVISSLASKNSHVPYRNSKLTQLLQDSLGGQAKTLMFVHISPEPDALGETISTLKFAERVSTIELGAARANKDGTDVKELKEQIASLKAALAHKEETSPDRQRLRSSGSSPSRGSWQSITDAAKDETKSNKSPSLSRRHSLDLQDMLSTSPSWPQLEDGLNNITDNCERPYQTRDVASDKSKVYPEQSLDKIHRRHSLDNGLSVANNDDSDEVDALTSDSSEIDYQWQQPNHRKSSNATNGVASKDRSAKPKRTVKSPEKRSSIPQPSKRSQNGSQSKFVRQPSSVRKPATAAK